MLQLTAVTSGRMSANRRYVQRRLLSTRRIVAVYSTAESGPASATRDGGEALRELLPFELRPRGAECFEHRKAIGAAACGDHFRPGVDGHIQSRLAEGRNRTADHERLSLDPFSLLLPSSKDGLTYS